MVSAYAAPVQRGSRIAITPEGVLVLAAGRFSEVRPDAGPSLKLGDRSLQLSGYEQVFDLAVAGDRVVALVEGDSIHNLPYRTLATTTLQLSQPVQTSVTNDIVRVAITNAAVITASDQHVHAYDGSIPGSVRIAERPLDLASTPTQIAVLDGKGVHFFDARGNPQGEVRLFAPTAIAVDPIDPGWLVAIDGGVFHLEGPGDVPHPIASVAEPIAKVRRSRDATYVLVGKELRAIHDDRVDVLGRLDDNAGDWNDFDAGPDGLELAKPFSASTSSARPVR